MAWMACRPRWTGGGAGGSNSRVSYGFRAAGSPPGRRGCSRADLDPARRPSGGSLRPSHARSRRRASRLPGGRPPRPSRGGRVKDRGRAAFPRPARGRTSDRAAAPTGQHRQEYESPAVGHRSTKPCLKAIDRRGRAVRGAATESSEEAARPQDLGEVARRRRSSTPGQHVGDPRRLPGCELRPRDGGRSAAPARGPTASERATRSSAAGSGGPRTGATGRGRESSP